MKSYQATWEDAEASRHVELVVNYCLDTKRVDIDSVTPTRVTFLCPQSREPQRSVRVWTEGGRKLLARQAAAAGRLGTLAQEIADGQLHELKHGIDKPALAATPVMQA
jgi:hypothetical protein